MSPGDDEVALKDGKDVVQAAEVVGVLAVAIEDDNKYSASWLGLVNSLFSLARCLAGGIAGGMVEKMIQAESLSGTLLLGLVDIQLHSNLSLKVVSVSSQQ